MNDMIDMSRFTEAKSDQLNADDLIGISKTITVTRVTGSDGDQPVAIYYQGDNGKPFKPCKTIRRVLMAVWGRYANEYVGKSMTIYRDDKVTFGGLETGGIRISHMSGIDKETVVVVMKTKGKKAGVKILPLVGDVGTVSAMTLEQGRADIEAADTLDALKTVWSRKSMAPFRVELQGDLDARKAALAFEPEGPADTQRGEEPSSADQLIARIEAADADELAKIEADYLGDGRVMFEVADQDRIEAAIELRKGGK